MTMKLKVKIAGPKVHDVGYRVFLLKNAMNLALPGLSTYNWEENGQQEVIVLVEGDETRIAPFLQAIEKNKPELAEVSKVTYEKYDGDIGRTTEVAMLCSFVQLDKAIPLLLDMRDDMKEMKGDIKAVRMTGIETLNEIKAVRTSTDAIPQVLEEIKGLREDIQPGYASNFRQVQADVRAIKERLGMQ
ncbi:Acylphosphatase [uncultured archaeon]|nr:Acylphosphatase [uncultured archaeon]